MKVRHLWVVCCPRGFAHWRGLDAFIFRLYFSVPLRNKVGTKAEEGRRAKRGIVRTKHRNFHFSTYDFTLS